MQLRPRGETGVCACARGDGDPSTNVPLTATRTSATIDRVVTRTRQIDRADGAGVVLSLGTSLIPHRVLPGRIQDGQDMAARASAQAPKPRNLDSGEQNEAAVHQTISRQARRPSGGHAVGRENDGEVMPRPAVPGGSCRDKSPSPLGELGEVLRFGSAGATRESHLA